MVIVDDKIKSINLCELLTVIVCWVAVYTVWNILCNTV